MSQKSDKDYYGSFFWLATISFIVPLFVAVSAFDKVQPSTKPTPHPDVSGVDHRLFDYLLRTYVENGLIDYEGISRDYLFTIYLSQLSAADPSQLTTPDDRLALHCNAYNAFVINGVLTHKIHRNEKNVLQYSPREATDRIRELNEKLAAEKRAPSPNQSLMAELSSTIDRVRNESGFFKLKEHIFAGQTISLDYLEHEVIRPTYGDPRIHVALVCAARSCPAIRAEAYVGSLIQQQLQDQAVQFAANDKYVGFDSQQKALKLSPILSWYAADWDSQGGVLAWLQQLVTDEPLKARIVEAQQGNLNVAYNEYDWSLNSQEGGVSGGGSKSAFGSGSVPNE